MISAIAVIAIAIEFNMVGFIVSTSSLRSSIAACVSMMFPPCKGQLFIFVVICYR